MDTATPWLLSFSLLLWVPAMAAAEPPPEDGKLAVLFKKYLDEDFRRRPLEATRLGEHGFDHLLDDVTPKAQAAWKEHLQQTLAQLPKGIAYEKLSRPGQIDFEIWRHQLQYQLWLADHTRPFAEDPRTYNNYLTESVYLLLTQSTQPLAVNVKNSAARMKFIPGIVAAARANLENPPRVMVETAIRQNRGAIAFYESGIFALAGQTPQLSDLGPPAREAVACLKDYQKFLETELLPRSKGEWRLGQAKFSRKLELELNAGLTALEVLGEAEAEADRVDAEMYVIARQLWSQYFPGQPLPPDDGKGRRRTVRLVLDAVSQEHGQPENLIKDAAATVERIRTFIKEKGILRLPEPDRCRIIEMPEFQRGNAIAYLNPAPPLDVKAASFYAVSPPPRDWDQRRVTSFLREYNRHMLQILTIHEAYPGHYVQLEYSNRHPSLIRKVFYSGAFAEGWAVYTEQMMLDQGYGQGDLKLRLMQLKWYLRTVCNAILDHKMHCGNMTDEEALQFLVERAYQSEGEALLKIIRAKQSSCQLSTYFVGRMAFVRLRRRLQTALGDNFNLGRFHEAVLAHGTLPVKYLPELVGESLQVPR